MSPRKPLCRLVDGVYVCVHGCVLPRDVCAFEVDWRLQQGNEVRSGGGDDMVTGEEQGLRR